MITSETGQIVLANYYRQQFAYTSPAADFIGNGGGFSGARLWKVRAESQNYCLRCWPLDESVSVTRLNWIHGRLYLAYQNGCRIVPVPMPSDEGGTVVAHERHLWQLEPWMPGVPDYYAEPNETKLMAAMKALAKFHEATAEEDPNSQPGVTGNIVEISPSLLARHNHLALWFDGKKMTDAYHQLRWCLENKPIEAQRFHPSLDWTELGIKMSSHFGLVAGHIQHSLAASINSPVRQQAIIGDIWHDHVLYSGDEITGFVDFGSMRIDTVACDVARLLGSLMDDYAKKWTRAISVYGDATGDAQVGVCREFHNLVQVFDQSTTALSGMNWLKWLYLDELRFEDYRAIANRLLRISFRLEKLLASL